MATNKEAVNSLLVDSSLYGDTRSQAHLVVEILIEKGFIEADPVIISDAEHLAEKARAWLKFHNGGGAKAVFETASGWSTESWKVVANDKHDCYCHPSGDVRVWKFGSYLNENKSIFKALCILANEAGIDYMDL